MGIMACYLSLNDALANEVVQLDNSAIITKIEQLMEDRLCPVYEMDKCWDGLPRIVASLQAVDRIALRKHFNLSAFREHQIYPNTWVDEETDERFVELTLELQSLISFYERSRDQGHDILVSIY